MSCTVSLVIGGLMLWLSVSRYVFSCCVLSPQAVSVRVVSVSSAGSSCFFIVVFPLIFVLFVVFIVSFCLVCAQFCWLFGLFWCCV